MAMQAKENGTYKARRTYRNLDGRLMDRAVRAAEKRGIRIGEYINEAVSRQLAFEKAN